MPSQSDPTVASPPPWARVAGALFAVGWGANQFSSLLLSYRAELGVGAATVDALFGVYALGLIPALLLGGPLSDRYGRRRVVLPTVVVSAVATGLLMLGATVGLPALYVGRLLAGIVSGLAFAPATAWVKELSAPPYDPDAGEQDGARRAAIALSAGFGLGPLTAGLLAQWAPRPMVLPYVAHLVVLAVAVPLLVRAPETVPVRIAAGRGVRAALHVPDAGHPRFRRVVAPMAPWVFGAASLSFAVLPPLAADRTSGWRTAFAASVTGLTLAVGVGIQPLARRLDAADDSRGAVAGLASVTAGAAVGAWAAVTGWPELVYAGAVLFGAGYGLCLVSGLLELQRRADPGRLAGLTAVFYALTYVGFAVPIVLAGLTRFAGYGTLLLGVAALALATLVAITRTSPRAPAVRTGARRR